MPKYLLQKGRRWYAVLEVPKRLREKLAKMLGVEKPRRRMVRSLETESLTEAQERVLGVVAGWKALFRQIDEGKSPDLDELALAWAQDYRAAERKDLKNPRDLVKEETREIDVLQDILEERAREIDRTSPGQGKAFYKIVTGESIPFDQHIGAWSASRSVAAKTIHMAEADVRELARAFPYSDKITRKEVKKWASRLRDDQNLAGATIRRKISAGRIYWEYLESRDYVPEGENPFDRAFPASRKGPGHGASKKRLEFTIEDCIQLYQAAHEKPDEPLRDLIALAMWTGCRIEELCSLKLKEVEKDRFTVSEAKTEAGNRTVPIHSKLAPVVSRLKEASSDGYLMSGLTANKFGDRSNAIGKRFGRLKASLGFSELHVFHSLRKTVATILREEGVEEGVSADLMGHELRTMTYGLYAGSVSFERLKVAIEQVDYPGWVDLGTTERTGDKSS